MKNDDPVSLTTIHSTLWAWENDLDLTKTMFERRKTTFMKLNCIKSLFVILFVCRIILIFLKLLTTLSFHWKHIVLVCTWYHSKHEISFHMILLQPQIQSAWLYDNCESFVDDFVLVVILLILYFVWFYFARRPYFFFQLKSQAFVRSAHHQVWWTYFPLRSTFGIVRNRACFISLYTIYMLNITT